MGAKKVARMKLLGLFIVGSFGVKLDKNTANQFLARNRRANSWGEELRKRGNLERECVEETCDFNEFNEVYDDMKVSQPLWYKFADCKNYVSKRLTPEKQKEQLQTSQNQCRMSKKSSLLLLLALHLTLKKFYLLDLTAPDQNVCRIVALLTNLTLCGFS